MGLEIRRNVEAGVKTIVGKGRRIELADRLDMEKVRDERITDDMILV